MKRHYLTYVILAALSCFVVGLLPSNAPAEELSKEEQYLLGLSYEASKDMEQAVHWYTLAAEQGQSEAQLALGDLYYRGEGVEQNYSEAFKWLLRSAEQGNMQAEVFVGALYAEGKGTEQDYAESLKWFRRASDHGSLKAMFNIGLAYDGGYGVAVDYNEAFKWYMKAAREGLAEAQFNVGIMYAAGDGTEQDGIESYRWINRAAEQGHPMAITARADLEKILTPAQLNLARSEPSTSPPPEPVFRAPEFKPSPEEEK